jgi:hypothetical protein
VPSRSAAMIRGLSCQQAMAPIRSSVVSAAATGDSGEATKTTATEGSAKAVNVDGFISSLVSSATSKSTASAAANARDVGWVPVAGRLALGVSALL